MMQQAATWETEGGRLGRGRVLGGLGGPSGWSVVVPVTSKNT